jgi:membrane fusion protein, multidrug efflux system
MKPVDTNTPVPVRRKRTAWLAAGAALLTAGAICGGYYWSTQRYIESTDNAYVKADSTTVAPKVAGYIKVLAAQDNQPVKAGDLLAEIDNRDYLAAVEHARAEVAVRTAALANARAKQSAHGAVIAQASARVEAARAAAQLARSDQARQQKMTAIGFVSAQQSEQSDADFKIKSADLGREEAGLANAKEQSAVLAADTAVAQSQLEQAKTALQRAELELSYTRIIAPADGVIAARTVRTGQFVQPGTQLMAVVPTQAVYVVANFKETQLGRVRGGEPATLRVDAFPDAELRGTVDSLAPASGLEFSLLPPDNATGNFTKIVQRVPVKIRLAPDNPLAGRLRPGMSVEASVDTAHKQDSAPGSLALAMTK